MIIYTQEQTSFSLFSRLFLERRLHVIILCYLSVFLGYLQHLCYLFRVLLLL